MAQEVFVRCSIIFSPPEDSKDLDKQARVLTKMSEIFGRVFRCYDNSHWVCETIWPYNADKFELDLSHITESYSDVLDSISCKVYDLTKPRQEFNWSKHKEE